MFRFLLASRSSIGIALVRCLVEVVGVMGSPSGLGAADGALAGATAISELGDAALAAMRAPGRMSPQGCSPRCCVVFLQNLTNLGLVVSLFYQ
jgi:hypothetical protein